MYSSYKKNSDCVQNTTGSIEGLNFGANTFWSSELYIFQNTKANQGEHRDYYLLLSLLHNTDHLQTFIYMPVQVPQERDTVNKNNS